MTCCGVWHDGDRLVGHLGSTRAAIVVEPDAVAADCFNTRRAILLKHSVRRLADAGQYVDLDAGYSRWRSTGEMAHRLLRAGIQYVRPRLLGQRRQPSDRQAKLPVRRELSDLLGRRGVRYRHLPQRPRPSSG
jgi:endoglucanase